MDKIFPLNKYIIIKKVKSEQTSGRIAIAGDDSNFRKGVVIAQGDVKLAEGAVVIYHVQSAQELGLGLGEDVVVVPHEQLIAVLS